MVVSSLHELARFFRFIKPVSERHELDVRVNLTVILIQF